jgi:peptidoglycan hydrolase CwlO-like protein
MRKYFSITLILLIAIFSYSYAQVDSSSLMKSQKKVEKQQNRVDKQQKRMERIDRKQEKQERKLNRRNNKLDKQNKRNNRNMRKMEKEQQKLDANKSNSGSGALLLERINLKLQNTNGKGREYPAKV